MSPTLPTLIRHRGRNVVLTARDRHILRALYEHRLLTTDHIQQLTRSKSRTKLNERLRTLFDANYLDRPLIQERLYAYEKKRPLVHALGNKGAAYIKESLQFTLPDSVDWTDKNRKLKSSDFFLHTLGVSDFFVALTTSIENTESVSLVEQLAVLAQSPGRTSTLPSPLTLPTAFQWLDNSHSERATVPDGMFALIDNRNSTSRKAFHFLEYDTGSMPVVRSSVNQSSIVKKMLGYADVHHRKIHTQRFGYKNFRVLFVTHGFDRIETMLAAYEKHVRLLCPAGAFLFADYDALLEHSPFGDQVWLDGNGAHTTLIQNS